jgi:glyoxylase-like metal-dependent hydrolase (beta-lactamase superfamily II)
MATGCEAVVRVGRFTVHVLAGGAFRLDGGAMFGIVPKPLWTRLVTPDDANRVPLVGRCLLVETGDAAHPWVLLETGPGDKFSEKEQQIFAVAPRPALRESLAAVGVSPEAISDIILTHLHCDHAGGLTRLDAAGKPVPTFPNARVHVRSREYTDARANVGLMTASYRPENLAPLDAREQWSLIDHLDEWELLPGLRTLSLPGHTAGHQGVLIADGGDTLLLPGDVVPTRHHVKPTHGMAYDLDPLANVASKRRVLELACERRTRVVLGHDPHGGLFRAERVDDGERLIPLAPDSR